MAGLDSVLVSQDIKTAYLATLIVDMIVWRVEYKHNTRAIGCWKETHLS